jgi:hypothetical protein
MSDPATTHETDGLSVTRAQPYRLIAETIDVNCHEDGLTANISPDGRYVVVWCTKYLAVCNANGQLKHVKTYDKHQLLDVFFPPMGLFAIIKTVDAPGGLRCKLSTGQIEEVFFPQAGFAWCVQDDGRIVQLTHDAESTSTYNSMIQSRYNHDPKRNVIARIYSASGQLLSSTDLGNGWDISDNRIFRNCVGDIYSTLLSSHIEFITADDMTNKQFQNVKWCDDIVEPDGTTRKTACVTTDHVYRLRHVDLFGDPYRVLSTTRIVRHLSSDELIMVGYGGIAFMSLSTFKIEEGPNIIFGMSPISVSRDGWTIAKIVYGIYAPKLIVWKVVDTYN